MDNLVVAAPLAAWLAVNLSRARAGRPPVPALPEDRVRLLVPLAVTVPAAAALALAEHFGGTPGRRVTRTRVRTAGGQAPGLLRTVVRSGLKTAIPWELGHQAVWDLRQGRTGRGSVLAAAAYGLLIAQAVAAARGSGRTYADRMAATEVWSGDRR